MESNVTFEQELSEEIYHTNYQGEDLCVEDTWRRQAVACAAVEATPELVKFWEEEFYWLLSGFKSSGGGRITANLGVQFNSATTLYNCFVNDAIKVMHPIDSLKGIYEQLDKQSQTLKSEGGYGHDFSYIRPKGSYIEGIGSRTPGVVSFMELWDVSSKIITMGSEEIVGDRRKGEKKKIRKGAQMGGLSVYHPEVYGFIDAKLQPGQLTKFNMSVTIPTAFMEAVEVNGDWPLIFPDTEHESYDEEWTGDFEAWMRKGLPVNTYEVVKARDLWDRIMRATYTRNEPGVLYVGLANKLNPISYAEYIRISNPCGEIMMSTGVCNLLSISLPRFFINGKFDFEMFKRAVTAAVRFSDNINDISTTPLPEYDKSVKEKRRIGVGTLGIGSLLYMMGIPFNSKEGLEMMEKIAIVKNTTELITSALLGKEKGSFLLFDADKYYETEYWKGLLIDDETKQYLKSIGCMRNSHHSANAPTGNMSIYLGMISGGIEPVYSKEYNRFSTVVEGECASLRKEGLKFPDVNKGEWFESEHLKITNRGTEEILSGKFKGIFYEVDKSRGLVKRSTVMDYGYKWCLENLTKEEIQRRQESGVFVTAEELTPQEHLDSLGIFAKHINQNSSKTINLPANISYEDFKGVYESAYKMNIKGVTTYRAGTMTAVLETISDEQDKLEYAFEGVEGVIQENVKLPSEYVTKGYVIKDNKGKKWYVNIAFVSEKKTKPFAIFVTTTHRESTEFADRTVNSLYDLAVTEGINKDIIEDLMTKMHHNSNVDRIARMISLLLRHNVEVYHIVKVLDEGGYPLSSFAFHIKRLLKQFIPDGVEVEGKKCQECGGKVIMSEGCYVCRDCGNSKCG